MSSGKEGDTFAEWLVKEAEVTPDYLVNHLNGVELADFMEEKETRKEQYIECLNEGL